MKDYLNDEKKQYTDVEIITFANERLEDSEYNEFEIIYILKDKDNFENYYSVAVNGDEIIGFNSLKQEIEYLPGWDYSADNYLFKDLEEKKEIIYMSIYCHYGIWNEINNYYPEDINHKNGMQKYLRYCKNHDITLDKIKDTFGNTQLLDVMQYLKKEKKELER